MLKKLLPAAALLAVLAPPAHAQGELTLYCSVLAEWCEIAKTEFERSSGVKVLMTVKSTGESLAQLRAETSNPRGDIWWGGNGDIHTAAAEQDLTQEYRSPQMAKLQPWARRQAADSNYKSVGIYAGTIGLVWNDDQLTKRKLAAPKCWSDLLKADFKDEIQMSNPNTSGTSYTILATLVQIMGEEKAFDYMKALHRNVNQYPRSGAAPMANTARGETLVSVTWSFAAVAEKALGAPVAYASPCEGTGYEIGSMSVVKGAKNLDNAKKFYEWALSPAAQATGVRAKSYQLPSHVDAPLPPNSPKLEDVKLIEYDFKKYGSSAERTRLLARWDKEIANAPK
jgi:iron(III) transport system substrate-binding protein